MNIPADLISILRDIARCVEMKNPAKVINYLKHMSNFVVKALGFFSAVHCFSIVDFLTEKHCQKLGAEWPVLGIFIRATFWLF